MQGVASGREKQAFHMGRIAGVSTTSTTISASRKRNDGAGTNQG
jgi:hypothetical protein